MPADKNPPASAERLQIYVTRYCGYCRAAERLLEQRGIPYVARSADDPGVRMELAERTHWRTVPIILLDGELIGGYQELRALDSSGELQRRLKPAGEA